MVTKSDQLPGSEIPPSASSPVAQPPRRGRPPKVKSIRSTQPVFVSLGLVDEAPALNLEKRGPGRPPKSETPPTEQGAIVLGKRQRGRPPGSKNKKGGPKGVKKGYGSRNSQAPLVVIPYASDEIPPTMEAAVSVAKRRGRPKKLATEAIAAPSAADDGGDTVYSGGVKKAVGRPRKTAPIAQNGVQVQDSDIVASVELKRKLDYFQAKVKEAVDVIKPYLSKATVLSVLKTIQELDGLISMDALRNQTQMDL